MRGGRQARRDLAIDLGSLNARVYREGDGVVFDEPSLLATSARGAEPLAIGREAEALLREGRPDVVAARPVARGVITEYDLARQAFRMLLGALSAPGRWFKPRLVVSVPSSLTSVERRAVEEAAVSAGARSVSLVAGALAAAVGAGLPIRDPVGSMIVDVGAQTTEIAMVAMGEVITSKFIPVGGSDMDEAIQRDMRARYGIVIGERAAERIKISLGSAYPAAQAVPVEINGREVTNGMPRTVTVTADEVREILSDPIRRIVDTARACLAESPPELSHDILETGLFLAGGGAALRGLDMRLAQECEVPVHLSEAPMQTVILGAGRILESAGDPAGAETSLGRR